MKGSHVGIRLNTIIEMKLDLQNTFCSPMFVQ